MRKHLKLIIIFLCMNIYGQKTHSINDIFNYLNKNSFSIDLNKSKNEVISINDSIKLLKLYHIDSLSVYYKIDLRTFNSLASNEAISDGAEVIMFSNSKKKGILFQINSASSVSKNKSVIILKFDIYEQYIFPYKILLNSNFEVDKIMNISWLSENLPKDILAGTEYSVQDYNTGLINKFRKKENYLNIEFNEFIDIFNKKKPINLIYELPNWLKKG